MKTNTPRPLTIYYCGMEECSPGHFFGPAVRPHYLIHFILKGRGIYKTPYDTFHLKEGQAFLIRPREVTYYEADKDAPWTYGWAAFDGPEADRIIHEYGLAHTHPVSETNSLDEVYFYLNRLIALFEGSSQIHDGLLGYFYLLMSFYPNEEQGEVISYNKGYLTYALSYIRHNYGYDINVNDIARHVGIDRTYLYRIFMEYEKLAPKQYLTDYRLMVARDMLINTSYNITEIALSCGFHDSSSFCKSFLKKEGITPLKFRKNGHKGGTKM